MREPTAGHWAASNNELVSVVLDGAGLDRESRSTAIAALTAAGLLVSARHWVPTPDDLYGMYHTLGDAYIQGRIKVRWVMCAETHDELVKRYRDKRYAVMPNNLRAWAEETGPSRDQLSDRIRMVMEANRRWGDSSMLFGIPIRIDPAARRPMFEIIGKEDP